MIGGAVRWATNKVDENVVSPVATRLANSVANPFVLSYFVWERVKEMTPQRARDLSRLVSTALANAVSVLSAEKGEALKLSTKRLQDEFVGAAVSRQGREVVLNSVATASKVAQALCTPETTAATHQLFETFQSVIDFFASEPGRKLIATAGECVTQFCAVAASPESSIFLAEAATNICHALDAEAQRRDAALDDAIAASAKHADAAFADLENKPNAAPPSPTWSNADTAYETESNVSFGARSRAGSYAATAPTRRRNAFESPPRQQRKHESSSARSARIEKDVLLKMGVAPAMIGEIQRILDAAAADDEIAQMQREDAAGMRASDYDMALTDNDDDDDDATISFAFGAPSVPTSFVAADAETTDATAGVVLPEWHNEPLRQALRRRHVRDDERAAQRNPSETQAREIATTLATRQVRASDLAPVDAFAVRAISFMLVGAVAVVLLLVVFSVYRSLI